MLVQEYNSVANTINSLHNKIVEGAKNVLADIVEIGEMLTKVKEMTKHGDFIGWVERNLTFSPRTAQRYMKVYENREKIKSIDVDKLSTAYKLLETPSSKK